MIYLDEHLRENRTLYNIYQVYKYIVFFPLLGMSTVTLFIIIFLFLFVATESFVQFAGVIWARFNSFVTPMFVKVLGSENIKKNRSYVVVANHQSQYDIFLMYGWLPLDFRWVMKIELRKIPILGYYCYKAGHIYVDRSNSRAAIESINAAKEKIRGGTSVVFFPEGTRSETGGLLDFKKGAFRFAIDMGLPILPVTIVGTRTVLPANSIGLFPGNAKMIIHKPIETGTFTENNISELADRTRQVIQDGLDAHAGRHADA
ncbi:MAG: 1-acyl-sn-glycerol-3-phosphate acyltransferase [Spirochaetes bacterium]|nr:1-acyl-sn-glycerol-3-phosphate acyltransferase [Spirochaetota bacterium]